MSRRNKQRGLGVVVPEKKEDIRGQPFSYTAIHKVKSEIYRSKRMGKPRQRQKADGISKLRKADKKRAKIKLGTHNQEYTSVCHLFGNWVAGPPKEPKNITSYYYVLSSCLPSFWREVGANRP